MTQGIDACHGRCLPIWPLRWSVAVALAALLCACGGGGSESDSNTAPTPVVQKGFGPTQLYNPSANPSGRVLQEGDTGIVFMAQAGDAGSTEQKVWFEIAVSGTYAVELEDEDLALLSGVDVADAADRLQLSVDATHRLASATLAPGRYVLRLIASSTNPAITPLFISFDQAPTEPSQPRAIAKLVPRTDSSHVRRTVSSRSCVGCDLSGANLSGVDLTGVDLRGTNMSGALLWQANLRGANLEGVNLKGADLRGANLGLATLTSAKLSMAKLNAANLKDADLKGADLSGADLFGALWVDGRMCAGASLGECG